MEGEWQPSSRKWVLRNLKGIMLKTDMDRAEADALLVVQEHYLAIITAKTCFAADLICQMHKDEDVYLKSYENGWELERGIEAYIMRYNIKRPHQSLESATLEEVDGKK